MLSIKNSAVKYRFHCWAYAIAFVLATIAAGLFMILDGDATSLRQSRYSSAETLNQQKQTQNTDKLLVMAGNNYETVSPSDRYESRFPAIFRCYQNGVVVFETPSDGRCPDQMKLTLVQLNPKFLETELSGDFEDLFFCVNGSDAYILNIPEFCSKPIDSLAPFVFRVEKHKDHKYSLLLDETEEVRVFLWQDVVYWNRHKLWAVPSWSSIDETLVRFFGEKIDRLDPMPLRHAVFADNAEDRMRGVSLGEIQSESRTERLASSFPLCIINAGALSIPTVYKPIGADYVEFGGVLLQDCDAFHYSTVGDAFDIYDVSPNGQRLLRAVQVDRQLYLQIWDLETGVSIAKSVVDLGHDALKGLRSVKLHSVFFSNTSGVIVGERWACSFWCDSESVPQQIGAKVLRWARPVCIVAIQLFDNSLFVIGHDFIGLDYETNFAHEHCFIWRLKLHKLPSNAN